MKRTIFSLAGVVVASAVVASCDSGAKSAAPTTSPQLATTAAAPSNTAVTTTAAPTTTTAPTTSAATTTTVVGLTPQGAYYVIASAANIARDQAFAAAGGTPEKGVPLNRTKEFCAAMGPALETFAKALNDTSWPAQAKDAVAALATASAGDAGAYYSCANAASNQAASAVYNAHDWNVGADAASAARLALGLPIDRA